jgi:phage anti-repressor protein
LQSNFQIDKDYIILDKKTNVKGIGKGKNNVKTVMLRYSSAKELTMISRSEKASTIRNVYIEIESLLIKYKESIIRELNQQLGINKTNKQLIQQII